MIGLFSHFKPSTHSIAAHSKISRGLRNKNPGNIRHSNAHWIGQSEVQTDKDFVQFDDYHYGIRALCKLLQAYQDRHGLKTIQELINRWAPPTENNTSAYVKAVCGNTYQPMTVMNMHDWHDLYYMVEGITMHENGLSWSGFTYLVPDWISQVSNGVQDALT